MQTRKYDTLEEAARFMGEPVERVRQRVEDNELPHVVKNGRLMIPALALRDFYYDHLLKTKKRPKISPEREDTSSTSPLSDTQRVILRAAGKDDVQKDTWLTSAFHAGKLAGMLPTEIHQLGLEGKVRTVEKNNRILYYRPDVEALKERGGPSSAPSSAADCLARTI